MYYIIALSLALLASLLCWLPGSISRDGDNCHIHFISGIHYRLIAHQ